MSADEVRGPRHAAPRKALFTRFHVPGGKAIALAAMPTAVLMGLGFTPTLALADGNDKGAPPANSLTADEYKACVEAMTDADKDSSASPTPSQSSTDEPGGDGSEEDKGGDSAPGEEQPGPSASAGKPEGKKDTGSSSSSDSGSDDKAGPTPSASASQENKPRNEEEASPSAPGSGGGLLEGLGDAIEDAFTGGEKAGESPSPAPTPSASASESTAEDASGTAKDTTDKTTGTAGDTMKDATDAASGAAEEATEPANEATEDAEEEAGEATASASAGPDPSEGASADPEDCPVATDDVGGVDNSIPVPEDPWHLEASSLLLKGASYEGIVEVRTASGNTKKVLKYVISKGTDIGDLHQIVKDEQIGKTHHVQAAEGSTSTIRDGDTVMYTESISGNLLGLIPITFDPEHPPPLDIPLIYFTDVKVVQAGQFGGTLHIPGMRQYVTD
ncbi:hypothetical protein GCM10022384_69480 [Streptomyces marokkonensis]|uniref:Membrane-bound hydrophilic protein n=1 Tax=Streptomyces marokkonensis TaxID=324855 RepID=A0ABP7SU13_9ACTN